MHADQGTDAGTIDVMDVIQVQHNALAAGDDTANCALELCEVAGMIRPELWTTASAPLLSVLSSSSELGVTGFAAIGSLSVLPPKAALAREVRAIRPSVPGFRASPSAIPARDPESRPQ